MNAKNLVENVISATDMKELWNEFSKKLIENGFDEIDMQQIISEAKTSCKRRNRCIAYVHPDRNAVFCFIYSSGLNCLYPLIMDKADFEKLDGRMIYLVKGRNDRVYLPAVKINGGIRKLHTLVCKCSDDMCVDHIAMSGSICTSNMLRPATIRQNCINTLYYTKVNGNSFEGSYIVTDDTKAQMLEEGYKFTERIINGKTTYKVQSPRFQNQDDLFKALNKCEKFFLGNFRYDPIKACTNEKEVFLHFVSIAFKWSWNEYKEAKKYFISKTAEDADRLFKYYGV